MNRAINTSEIRPRKFNGGWLIARNTQVYGKLPNGDEIASFEAWTGERWSWHTPSAKHFPSEKSAASYVVENRERLGG